MMGKGVGGHCALVCVIILNCGCEVWLRYKEYGRHYQDAHSDEDGVCVWMKQMLYHPVKGSKAYSPVPIRPYISAMNEECFKTWTSYFRA